MSIAEPEHTDRAARAERLERALAKPVIVAAFFVIPLLVLESTQPGGAWPTVLEVANWAIWAAFLVEAVVMLAVVENRWKWIREHPVEVAVILFTVPVLTEAFEVLRVLRLLRLVALVRIVHVVFSVNGLRYAALLAFMALIAAGEAFAQIEDVPLKDGMYWAITTMTSVGYGDISPQTDTGKLMAGFVMVIGLAFAAILTGAMAERFISSDVDEAIDEAMGEAETRHELEEEELRRELREISDRLARLHQRL